MNSNASLAAQAVAQGPMTAAPPSFDGHGWLVVVNLAIMTFAALICGRQSLKLAYALAIERATRGPLVLLLRWMLFIALGGMTIRTGVEALTLWGWNPLQPVATGWYLTLKRLLDPFGGTAYIVAAGLFAATEDTLTSALERKPFPERLVASLSRLKGSACFAAFTLVACVLVVTFR